jgi:hypothetical protein
MPLRNGAARRVAPLGRAIKCLTRTFPGRAGVPPIRYARSLGEAETTPPRELQLRELRRRPRRNEWPADRTGVRFTGHWAERATRMVTWLDTLPTDGG